MNLAMIGLGVSEEKMFLHCGRRTEDENGTWVYHKLTYIDVYSPRAGADNTLGSNFFINTIIQ